ncbi:glycoside hydrolase family 47 protein [Hyaloscypha variabilis]
MHYSRLSLPLVALLALPSLALPHDKPPDKRADNHQGMVDRERADAVKAAFVHAWTGYKKYAFPHDELHPVSNSFSDSRNGWGASAIDAFSTACVMQIPDIVNTILDYIPTIDFDHTTEQVSLFETTIRYMAGMLSGYDFLKGPLSNLAENATAVDEVLKQVQRLADNLAYAFNTPTGIPSNNLNFPNTTDGSTTNGLAQIGSLVLEWTHLSDLTGDQKYAKLSQKGESYLLAPQPSSSEPWPGLVGTNVDLSTGLFQDAFGGWVGGDDSFYEYLIKMYVYDSAKYSSYKDRWILAADSTIAHLASHPSTRPDVTFVAEFNGQELIFQSEHLACFDGGSFLLGGLALNEQKYIDFGLALVNGCHDTYVSTETGIGPEVFQWVENTTSSTDPNNPPAPANQEAFYEKSGFYITDSDYILRPEYLESVYYAYRATGNQMYRDWSWDAFLAINNTCAVGSGYAELTDVNASGGGGFNDFMDSFFFAEVLKYAYLTQAPVSAS